MWQPKPPMWAPGIRQGHPLAQGLQLAWPIWTGGGSLAGDVSGNGRAGTIAAGTTHITTQHGRALSFDGSTGMVSRAAFDHYAAFSFCLIYRPTAATTGNWFGVTSGIVPATWSLYRNGNDLRFYVNGFGTTERPAYVGAAVTNAWHHLVGTWAGNNTQRLWKDGAELSATASTTCPASLNKGAAHTVYLSHNSLANTYLAGECVLAMIWLRTLQPGEAVSLYADPWSLITPRRRSYFYAATAPGSLASPWYYHLQQAVAA